MLGVTLLLATASRGGIVVGARALTTNDINALMAGSPA